MAMLQPLQGVPCKNIAVHFDETFPFPFIPATIRPIAIKQDPAASSGAGNHTKPSAEMRRFKGNDALKTVFISEGLWGRLTAYADRSAKDRNVDVLHTLDLTPDGKTEATPTDIAAAVIGLNGQAAVDFSTGEHHYVSTKGCAWDGMGLQFATVMQFMMLQRYACILDSSTVSFPRWRDNDLKSDRRFPGVPTNSGQADAILDGGPVSNNCFGGSRNAVVLYKTPWVYSRKNLDDMFVRGSIVRGQGSLSAASRLGPDTVEMCLTLQLWGSMVNMRSNFAIWTNGEEAFVACRSGTSVILSERHEWNNRDTFRALGGLTYAALDEGRWSLRNVNLIDRLTEGCRPLVGLEGEVGIHESVREDNLNNNGHFD